MRGRRSPGDPPRRRAGRGGATGQRCGDRTATAAIVLASGVDFFAVVPPEPPGGVPEPLAGAPEHPFARRSRWLARRSQPLARPGQPVLAVVGGAVERPGRRREGRGPARGRRGDRGGHGTQCAGNRADEGPGRACHGVSRDRAARDQTARDRRRDQGGSGVIIDGRGVRLCRDQKQRKKKSRQRRSRPAQPGGQCGAYCSVTVSSSTGKSIAPNLPVQQETAPTTLAAAKKTSQTGHHRTVRPVAPPSVKRTNIQEPAQVLVARVSA